MGCTRSSKHSQSQKAKDKLPTNSKCYFETIGNTKNLLYKARMLLIL